LLTGGTLGALRRRFGPSPIVRWARTWAPDGRGLPRLLT